MKLKFSKYELELGDVNYADDAFTMKSGTSYVEKVVKKYKTSKAYREALLPLKIKCLENIKESLGAYDSYLDLLAGIGMSGKVFFAKENLMNDFDGPCIEILMKNFPQHQVSSFDVKKTFPFKNFDFIFGDFNNLTIKRLNGEYGEVVDNIFSNANKYVLINDCSAFYLKYGKKSYEVYAKVMGKEPAVSRDGLYRSVREWLLERYGWYLNRVEGFRDTSFLLFGKRDEGFHHRVNTTKDGVPKVTIQ